MSKDTELRFHKNGSFRILHMTDIQEGIHPRKDTIRLMEAALDKTKPDIVVLTGDQLKGYDLSYRFASKERIARTINQLMQPMVERNIPFAVTFGNHDQQCGLTNEEQMQVFLTIPGMINTENGPGSGTCSLRVLNDQGQEALKIYLLDSGGKAKGGGYEAPTEDKLQWLEQQLTASEAPGILFQHIPLTEYKKCKNITWNEPVCSPNTNTGEFDRIKRSGKVFAVYCGHDHKNDFVGTYQNIDLGYTPSCGFASYGPGVKRACRLLEFQLNKLPEYKTELIRYEDVVAPHTGNRIKEYVDMHLPTCWPPERGGMNE